MNWLRRLFKGQSSTEKLRELLDEVAFSRRREVADVVSRIDQALQSDVLANDETALLTRGRIQIVGGNCSTIHVSEELGESMKALWQPPVPDLDVLYDIGRYPTPKPNKREWALALTDEFIKSTGGIDRKLQGRILEALLLIASAPTSPRGDTFKALTGDLAGLWRFRLGDFRLLYKPDEPTMRIYLLSFGGRGAIYH